MKKFRTSFSHLVREKLISGQDDSTPTPETRDLVNLYPGVVHSSTGNIEFVKDTEYITTTSSGGWTSQGSMGYGDPPIGTGTTPYRSFLSNKVDSTYTVNAYDGSPGDRAEITFGPLHHSGCGATFAVGNATHYTTHSGSNHHAYPQQGVHKLISVYGVTSSASHVAGLASTDVDGESNGSLHFCYENTTTPGESTNSVAENNKSYRLFVEHQDTTGTKSRQLLISNVHFITSYGRLLPVAFELLPSGDFLFSVDNTELTGNLNDITNKSDSPLQMPASGELYMAVRSMNVSPYVSPYSGVYYPVSRVTNIAINDNDDSDGRGDVGRPPYITGVPCTPVRATTTDWDLPLQVNDPDSGWLPYSESSPTVEYGLSAVADNQMFETRGVAASGTDKPLHIYTANKSTLSDLLNTRSLGSLNDVEAINTILYDSAVFGENNMTIQVNTADTYTALTDTREFQNIQNDFNNSAVTYFHDIAGLSMDLDTFSNGMVFTLTVNTSS